MLKLDENWCVQQKIQWSQFEIKMFSELKVLQEIFKLNIVYAIA